MTTNLVDLVWGKDRPARPAEPVLVLDKKYAGKDYVDKIADIRKDLEKKNSHGLVLSGLDEIMWLFNVRGTYKGHTSSFSIRIFGLHMY